MSMTVEIILKQLIERVSKDILKAYARVETLEDMRAYLESYLDANEEAKRKESEVKNDL